MRHAYGDANVHSDRDCDGNCHIHADGDSDGNCHVHSDGHSDIYCNGNGNCDRYSYGHSHRTAAAYTDATASADTAGPSGHLLFRQF
jgi:hypothetical protein